MMTSSTTRLFCWYFVKLNLTFSIEIYLPALPITTANSALNLVNDVIKITLNNILGTTLGNEIISYSILTSLL